MSKARLGVVSMNPKVGDFKNNVDLMLPYASHANDLGCNLLVYAEGCVTGYPCSDFLLLPFFFHREIEEIYRFCEATMYLDTIFVIGGFLPIPSRGIFNCAFVIHKGKVVGITPKQHLPNYGIFYEKRTTTEGKQFDLTKIGFGLENPDFGDLLFEINGSFIFSCEICETSWVPDGPMRHHGYEGAVVHAILNASPFRSGVENNRKMMLRQRSIDDHSILLAAYQVGGNGELSFDGGGYIIQEGECLAELERFQPGIVIQDVDFDEVWASRARDTTWKSQAEDFIEREKLIPSIYTVKIPQGINIDRSRIKKQEKVVVFDEIEEIINAIIMGMGDYFRKVGTFDRMLISISGGRDSVLVAILAYEWAIRNNLNPHDVVTCVSFPTSYNSDATRNISKDLCETLGLNFYEQSIAEPFQRESVDLRKLNEGLGFGEADYRIADQNIQARIRATKIANLSNICRGLVLCTSNMSETAVGYATKLGDMQGDFAPISGCRKTKINKILEYFYLKALANQNDEQSAQLAIVLARLIYKTVASAELAENQEDERELMPFEVLDSCYELLVTHGKSPYEIALILFEKFEDYLHNQIVDWVKKFFIRFFGNIHKWVQKPQGTHLEDIDLDTERTLQYPTVFGFYFLKLDELERLKTI